ncbi:MAG: hypothetical protein JGK17_31690 [Microcoleus sp. PH2017_10_PVI_O_A]|nr:MULTISPECIES: hypothetical protein [unclassified Microcoleus]MCC3410019.1 hypothetical protein [Microcoleus sp. PH2017_10_PVI_O_A]MCC3464279.1 hypothetical protein [Microcoleus sp. PH2017_11_PCY_U_A]MCC3531537.1 hypothetical protein [Microcoleus sp. PH2017_21_RUC_O_A]MCC3543867.1 hypothetical protein [Microcoleus sp. PH2017_22_RUC_O_B]MCC3563618.1 hypothetical protein [Microcoleus sp. PH2017_27_LUM_O_A]
MILLTQEHRLRSAWKKLAGSASPTINKFIVARASRLKEGCKMLNSTDD